MRPFFPSREDGNFFCAWMLSQLRLSQSPHDEAVANDLAEIPLSDHIVFALAGIDLASFLSAL